MGLWSGRCGFWTTICATGSTWWAIGSRWWTTEATCLCWHASSGRRPATPSATTTATAAISSASTSPLWYAAHFTNSTERYPVRLVIPATHYKKPLRSSIEKKIHVIPCRYSHTSLGLVRIYWSSPIYWNVSVGGAGYRKKRSATCWSTRATCWRWWPPWCSCATCRCRSRSVAPASAWLNWATPWPSSSTTPASQRRQWAPATSYKYRSFSHFNQDWFDRFRAMHSF